MTHPHPEKEDRNRLLSEMGDWVRYYRYEECPRCSGSSFKLCFPPICVDCGWHARQGIDGTWEDVLRLIHRLVSSGDGAR